MSLETCPVQCPYCGETIEVSVEALGETQTFIEDCSVCCHPIQFTVNSSEDGLDVNAERSD